jgi:hypothetical protein
LRVAMMARSTGSEGVVTGLERLECGGFALGHVLGGGQAGSPRNVFPPGCGVSAPPG